MHFHSYSSDLMVLRNRAGPSSAYRFHQVKQHVEAAADRVVCVVGGPGEGKSTLAAMMLENVGDAFVHAAHFCKRTDTNRQVRGSHTFFEGYNRCNQNDLLLNHSA